MTSGSNSLLDPSVCSCFTSSYQYTICNKIKWSTLSIGTAVLIIIVYLTSGLYALIDVTTITSTKSSYSEDVLWPIASSSLISILGWASVSIYFTVVLLITILLCGIQLGKPWILFFWSIMMIFMLLADGIVTVLSLREYQQENYRSIKQIKLLFFVMSVRLIVSLCGIFVTVFHFRRLKKVQSDYKNRQRILDRYNSGSSSSSYHGSWTQSVAVLNPSKHSVDDRYVTDAPLHMSLPRAKVATVQHHPTSTMFHSYNQKLEYITPSYQRAINRHPDNDFRYNIPLQERFHQQKFHDVEEF